MKKAPFHPLLLGLYPALMMLAENVSQVLFEDTVRVFYFSLLLIVVFFLLSYAVIRSWHKAALISSLVLVLFFSYGHVYSVLQGAQLGPVVIGRTLVLLPVYFLLLAVGTWLILTRPFDVRRLTQGFNIVGLILLAYPLYTITSYYIHAERIRSSHRAEIPSALSQKFEGEVPSIYYIILDMHARTDVLQEIYGYDNTWFIDSLKQMGFYVAEESTSNYSSTLQSISSSLNMDYINYLQETYGPDSNNREPFGLLLAQNQVTSI